MSTRGNQRRAERVGWFEFPVGQTPARPKRCGCSSPGRRKRPRHFLSRRDHRQGDLRAGRCGRQEAAERPFLLDFNLRTTRPAPFRITTTAPFRREPTSSRWPSARARWTRTITDHIGAGCVVRVRRCGAGRLCGCRALHTHGHCSSTNKHPALHSSTQHPAPSTRTPAPRT
jgi:hypothetical protein